MACLPSCDSAAAPRASSLRFRWALWLCLLAVLVVGACLIIPIPHEISPRFTAEQLAQLKKGVTTRAAVQELLGEPDIRRGDHTFYYAWSESGFFMPWMIVGAGTGGAGAGGGVAGGALAGTSSLTLLTIQFDENAIVRDVDLDPDTDSFNRVVYGDNVQHAIRIIAPDEDDADAKLFKVLPDRCSIYVFGGGRASLGSLSIDGREVVPVLSGTFTGYYVLIATSPGSHTLQQRAPHSSASLDIACNAGELLFFNSGMRWFSDDPEFERLDEGRGHETIAAHKRILTRYAAY